MGLNPNAQYPVTMKIGSTTYNLDVTAFSRKCGNKPIIVNKPMTQQNGVNSPETLYKDLKNIGNTISISFRVYSKNSSSPIAIAEDIIDKLHKEAPPVVIVYRGYTFNCVFNSFTYKDNPRVAQYWRSAPTTKGGTTSPSYVDCNIELTKGTKRL